MIPIAEARLPHVDDADVLQPLTTYPAAYLPSEVVHREVTLPADQVQVIDQHRPITGSAVGVVDPEGGGDFGEVFQSELPSCLSYSNSSSLSQPLHVMQSIPNARIRTPMVSDLPNPAPLDSEIREFSSSSDRIDCSRSRSCSDSPASVLSSRASYRRARTLWRDFRSSSLKS